MKDDINKNLALVKELIEPEDLKFLEKHSPKFKDRYTTSSMFRSKFEMESFVLNDDEHPTADSKYWQAIGEQAVHVKELIRLGYESKKSEADLELLMAEIEELESKMQEAEASKKPGYELKKLQACIHKKNIEIKEKQFGLTECKKVAKERIKEIKNWEEIIPQLEEKLQHGKGDWEKHHPERYFKRYQKRVQRFDILDNDSKENVIKHFLAAGRHPENKELAKEHIQDVGKALNAGGQPQQQVKQQQEEQPQNQPQQTQMPQQEQPQPDGLKLQQHPQVLQQPKESSLKDYKSREELTAKDPIARGYFDRKVRKIMVATPHRYQNDFNVTDFNMLQIPAAFDSFIEQPWGFNVPDARNFIVKKALKDNIDYIFFVDDDVVIPRNALVQLFSHKAYIAGGMYYRKYLPLESVPMVERKDTTPAALTTDYEVGEVMHNTLVLPSGCTLIKTEVFKDMKSPWYKAFTVNNRAAVTEDTYICQRIRELKKDILMDTGIQCLHVNKESGQIFGHPDIVDVKTNRVNLKYQDYFAAKLDG